MSFDDLGKGVGAMSPEAARLNEIFAECGYNLVALRNRLVVEAMASLRNIAMNKIEPVLRAPDVEGSGLEPTK